MSDARESPAATLPPVTAPGQGRTETRGNWKPTLTLLVLAPAIGELLSGSSPPLQFFNPIFFLLLVALYGCGALLVREIVTQRRLNSAGLLLLAAAYGIIEEGLMCKSFFNPYWTDTGFLSVYGRAWGVNWVWAFGLTFYHMCISVIASIFITEALFAGRAREPWLRRRGRVVAGGAFALVVLLGYFTFDNRQFHLVEMNQSLALARRLENPVTPLDHFIASQLNAKSKALVGKAVAAGADSPDLRHALQEELNRLLARRDFYSAQRFAGVRLPDKLKSQTAKPPKGDELVQFNRVLLEAAFPGILPARPVYPFRLGWRLTVGCTAVILGLVLAALAQTRAPRPGASLRRPWLAGLGFTAGFVVLGFVLPSMVEHGMHLPASLLCFAWSGLALLVGIVVSRMDGATDRCWRRGLWALGAVTPWVGFAMLLGLVGMIGAKNFLGMPVVSLAFGAAILALGLKWKRRLAPKDAVALPETAA